MYASGKHAVGFCQRCGLPYGYLELVEDGQVKGLRVCLQCYDPKHPQERPSRGPDPIALRDPAPETIAPRVMLMEYPYYDIVTGRYAGTNLAQFTVDTAPEVA